MDIALGLAARGIATVRYDKRTRDYPRSLNPRAFTMSRSTCPTRSAAIGLLEHEPAVSPYRIFVLGHSQGGTYAPLIAKRAPEVAGVVLTREVAEIDNPAALEKDSPARSRR